jgi:hypothetical protein
MICLKSAFALSVCHDVFIAVFFISNSIVTGARLIAFTQYTKTKVGGRYDIDHARRTLPLPVHLLQFGFRETLEIQ